MKRREFIGGIATTVVLRPIKALTQTPSRRPVIGYLAVGTKAATERYRSGFPRGMRELGFIEGRDYVFEDRYADGDLTRLPSLAEQLVSLKPDVILPGTMPAVIAVKKLTDTIPIVSEALTDPVGFGVVASYARPGGNVTGILITLDTLPGKQLDLGLELIPGTTQIGMLVNVSSQSSAFNRQGAEAAAIARHVRVVPAEVRTPDDIDAAIQALVRERVEILFVPLDAMLLSARRRIATLALVSHLPVVSPSREYVEDGALMSYGINLHENWRRTASFVDRILKGARPHDLPVEFPTKLELLINLTTARALGLKVPPTFLARADEVIE